MRSKPGAVNILELVHVVCAALWLGNFTLTGIWALRAFRTKDAALRRFAVGEIIFTDILFTLTLGIAVTITGIALASAEHVDIWATRWTALALGIVIVSGLAWLALLLPAQFAMLRMSRAGEDPAALERLFLRWNVVGWSVTALLFFVIYLMVFKPV